MKKIIECVPNFSEGRNMEIIQQITAEIEKIKGVKLLDVDPGFTTNRTVVTFVGTPDEVCEAAFQCIKKAQELIDMRVHKGDHPRFGATDVCPLVPVSNITMEETVVYARKLSERVGKELNIPVYCYEQAAYKEEYRSLANCRKGEYEELKDRLSNKESQPNFGPTVFNESVAKSGATAIGARDFLVAVNYNLNTTSTRRANAIAFDVREKGRPSREGNSIVGKIKKDADGNPIMISGTLKATKAIGWYIKEYGIAQVSMNLNNLSITPLHIAFDEVCRCAHNRGIRVTGCEIVGLVPKKVLINAGKYYLEKQKRSLGIPDEEIIKIAIKSMGLDDLKPFNYKEKIIEYLLEEEQKEEKLVDLSCVEFANETSKESPAPGGGSISAYIGALGASLGMMVANLSAHKPGWDEQWETFSDWAVKGEQLKKDLLFLVDEDTRSFNRIIDAFGLPKTTEEEKAIRKKAIQDATKYAIEIPFKTMGKAFEVFELCKAMAQIGNPTSVSDAGVGALCIRAAVMGSYLNVKINASSLDDKVFVDEIIKKADAIIKETIKKEEEILKIVLEKL